MTDPGLGIGIDEIGIEDVIERYEFPFIEQAERAGLLWALKVSDVGQALLDIWRDEMETYTRQLTGAAPDDPILITHLQSLIYTRRNWISRVENAQEPVPDSETAEPRTE